MFSSQVLRIPRTLHPLRTEHADHVYQENENKSRPIANLSLECPPFFSFATLNPAGRALIYSVLRAPTGGVLLVSSARANPVKFLAIHLTGSFASATHTVQTPTLAPRPAKFEYNMSVFALLHSVKSHCYSRGAVYVGTL